MKLTKKQEKDIWQVYDTWLHSYLNGDVKTYTKYLDKDYHFIGSTNNEEFLNKKDTTNFFKATADQLAGKCDLRNENKIIEKFEGLVFVTHLFDAWFKNGSDYTYYGRFRFTNTLKENKTGWRFIYQHFSTTDSKTDDGDTIGFDKVNIENQELREAIKRRTFELEEKNRELEVETALERIRVQAVAMNASSDLFDIVVTMRNEFLSLGHKADYFWHMKWLEDNYEMSMTAEDGSRLGMVITVPKFVHKQIESLHNWEKSNSPYFVLALNGKEAWDYIDNMNTHGKYQQIDPHAPTEEDILHIGGLTFIIARTTHGEIGFSLAGEVPDPPKASIETLLRFAKVFDLAYKRFEDLQKAEAQARETQIELALEKVRSRTMAMQHSEELSQAAEILYEEFNKLGITPFSCGYLINDDSKKHWNVWMTDANDASFKSFWTLPFNADHHLKDRYTDWKKKKPFHSTVLVDDENIEHHKIIAQHAPWKKTSLKDLPDYLVLSSANFKHGHLLIVTGTVLTEQMQSILIRFAKVFEQTYTRFLDLKKAEAQARESEIELALERVRARTMAMQHSDELAEASFLLDQQVRMLGIKTWGCAFNIYGENESTEWFGNEAGVLHTYKIPREGIFKEYYQKGQKGESLVIKEFKGKECVAHYEYMSSLPIIGDVLKTLKETNDGFPTYQIDHVVFFKYGYLLFITREDVPEAHDIFKRFAKVFEQTYTRFLDLQKSEAQAREAQIEAALERVRSQSMGMQTSKDLSRVTTEMFNQLRQFGGDLFATGIVFCDKHEGHVEQWHSLPDAGMMSPFIVPIDLDYIHQYRYDEWKKGTELFSVEIPSDFIEQHFQDIFNLPSAQKVLKDFEDQNTPMPEAPPWEIDYGASFKHGYMLVSSLQPFKEKEILPRFAKVFEQAYTRFLDLQKAEAQARKAQIEASLERVRAKAMSMQNSDELDEVLSVLCEQFDVLGIVPMSTHMTVLDLENNTFTFRETGKFGNRSFGEQTVALDAMDNWKETVDKWKADKATAINKLHFPKEQLSEVWKVFHESFASMPEGSRITPDDYPDGIFHTAGKHPFGYIGMNQIRPATEEEEQIVIKFANEFGMAYQRFLDLKKAEAQAREAQIETALEKVRSRTMAMQHSDELPEAANNLFLQVQALGIPAWSAGYCIWESEDKKSAWCNMSSEGEIQKGFSLPSIGEGYNNYDPAIKGETFHVAELGGKALVKHYDFMKKLPIVGEILEEFVEKGIALPTFQIFHIVYFTHGYLMFITYEDVPNEWNIFIRFGKVFEQTYTRFLDLKRAEAQSDLIKKEKERLEVTISELKATQSQLIQSEKMASLGELTAGIAHEIQNPLNFVNNFSEVSKELLEEMAEEIENGDFEEVKAIMTDVVQNLEKINHHGKRADGIVKGMLQHSRASGDKKEPTNINALADEYLRLAYHGLRAKDKSFNATLETSYDETISEIQIIPQDIGRVILNLITNAFYAVDEKKKSGAENYEPTVWVSTKKNSPLEGGTGDVSIIVKDNGNGIPKKVIDKIFQPFFTTKPTGKGTGLGLSMSYDIIKAHGGELNVKTKEGKETIFMIKLPKSMTNN